MLFNWGGVLLTGRLITEGALLSPPLPPPWCHGTTRALHHTEKTSQQEEINRSRKPLLSPRQHCLHSERQKQETKNPPVVIPPTCLFLFSSNYLLSSQRSVNFATAAWRWSWCSEVLSNLELTYHHIVRQKLQLLSALPLIHITANLGDHSEVKELAKQLFFFLPRVSGNAVFSAAWGKLPAKGRPQVPREAASPQSRAEPRRARPALPSERAPGGSGTGLCPRRPPVLGSPACAGRRCGPGRRRAARHGASPRCAGARGAGGPLRRRGPGTAAPPAAAPAQPPCPGAAPARPPRPGPGPCPAWPPGGPGCGRAVRGARLREALPGPLPAPGPAQAFARAQPSAAGLFIAVVCAQSPAGKCISFSLFPAWRRDLWRFTSGEGKQRCQLSRLAVLSLFQNAIKYLLGKQSLWHTGTSYEEALSLVTAHFGMEETNRDPLGRERVRMPGNTQRTQRVPELQCIRNPEIWCHRLPGSSPVCRRSHLCSRSFVIPAGYSDTDHQPTTGQFHVGRAEYCPKCPHNTRETHERGPVDTTSLRNLQERKFLDYVVCTSCRMIIHFEKALRLQSSLLLRTDSALNSHQFS